MSVAPTIQLPKRLNLDAANLAIEWTRFLGEWTHYAQTAKVYQETADCQAAILLAFLGTEAFCLYLSMPLTDAQRQSCTALLDAFGRHCSVDVIEEENERTNHREEMNAPRRESPLRIRPEGRHRRPLDRRQKSRRRRIERRAAYRVKDAREEERQSQREENSAREEDVRRNGTSKDFADENYERLFDATDECESILVLNDESETDDRVFTNILVNGKCVKFLLNGVSTTNTISKSIYESLMPKPALRPANRAVRLFNDSQLLTEGIIEVTLQHPVTMKKLNAEVYVTASEKPILSMATCRKFNLIQIVEENICQDDSVMANEENLCDDEANDSGNSEADDENDDEHDDFKDELFNGDLFCGNLGENEHENENENYSEKLCILFNGEEADDYSEELDSLFNGNLESAQLKIEEEDEYEILMAIPIQKIGIRSNSVEETDFRPRHDLMSADQRYLEKIPTQMNLIKVETPSADEDFESLETEITTEMPSVGSIDPSAAENYYTPLEDRNLTAKTVLPPPQSFPNELKASSTDLVEETPPPSITLKEGPEANFDFQANFDDDPYAGRPITCYSLSRDGPPISTSPPPSPPLRKMITPPPTLHAADAKKRRGGRETSPPPPSPPPADAKKRNGGRPPPQPPTFRGPRRVRFKKKGRDREKGKRRPTDASAPRRTLVGPDSDDHRLMRLRDIN